MNARTYILTYSKLVLKNHSTYVLMYMQHDQAHVSLSHMYLPSLCGTTVNLGDVSL